MGKDIGPAFTEIVYDNLRSEMGWPDDKIRLGIEVSGHEVLSAARCADALQGQCYATTELVNLLEGILGNSTSFEEVRRQLNSNTDRRWKFRGHKLVAYLRGVIFALEGNYDLPSCLDKLPDEPLKTTGYP